jgi:hypothetical protein
MCPQPKTKKIQDSDYEYIKYVKTKVIGFDCKDLSLIFTIFIL